MGMHRTSGAVWPDMRGGVAMIDVAGHGVVPQVGAPDTGYAVFRTAGKSAFLQ